MSDTAPVRRFAISDIHGCARTFKRLVKEKLRLQPGDTLFLLGDYVDRGPDAKGVLDYIFKLQTKGVHIHALRGNHEDLLLKGLYSKSLRRNFLLNGGDTTLKSFGVKALEDIPEKYIAFLRQLDYYFEVEDKLLVHAGFNFQARHIFEDREAMIWIRGMDIEEEKLGNRYVIHGHTPQSKMDIKRQFNRQPRPRALNIDCGCVYRHRFGARLCALNLDTWQLHFSRNVDF